MCASLILGSLKLSLHFFNALHILAGLVIAGFGCYLQIEYGTYVVTIVSLVLGGYILILGCLGLIAVRTQKWCLLTSYTLLMGIIFFVNAAILIVAFASWKTLVGSLDTDNGDVDKFADDLEGHKHIYQIMQSAIVVIEFCCLWFALLFRKKEGKEVLNDEGYAEFEKSASRDYAMPDPGHWDPQQEDEVMTTSQQKRKAMREKYGLIQ